MARLIYWTVVNMLITFILVIWLIQLPVLAIFGISIVVCLIVRLAVELLLLAIE